MTIQTTPQTPQQAQPVPQPRQVDWRELDFAADGLVLRKPVAER